MLIQPKIRGFICTTAHPVGCAAHVQRQIDEVLSRPAIAGPKRVLVIGASAGYGLASRIAAAFGCDADTIGVFFEKPATENRTGTAGWYNTAALEEKARARGRIAESVNGDAFSNEVKAETIALIQKTFGQVDLVIYSLASPRRKHPDTEEVFSSAIKPIGQSFTDRTVDVHSGVVSDVTVAPATPDEISQTVAVMGGADWELWMDALTAAGVMADGAMTVAYSYIGPSMTRAVYRDGTIGRAKNHLEETAHRINQKLQASGGQAFVSINKAVVTQSSSAIPVVPLYIALLFKVMKADGSHEDCIEQMVRLFAERLYTGAAIPVDEARRIRLDEREMQPHIQEQVDRLWASVTTENLLECTDIAGYRSDFLKLFGFGLPEVDYDLDVDPNVQCISAVR